MSNENTYLSRDELCDLAHGIKRGFLRWNNETVASDEVLKVIASLRNEIKGPNNGLILAAAKIISNHIRDIQCIQDAANFPPDVPKCSAESKPYKCPLVAQLVKVERTINPALSEVEKLGLLLETYGNDVTESQFQRVVKILKETR